MPTELVDGNVATAPGLVNAQELGQAMARELANSLKQNATPEQKVDEVSDLYSALKAAGLEDNEIQAHISTALGVNKKMDRLLEEKAKETTTRFLQHQTNKELTSTVGRLVRSYSKEDELIQLVAPSIRTKAMERFMNGATGDIVSARNKFLNGGELDEDVLDDIITKEVEAIEKARTGKKGTAAPAVKSSDTTARPTEDDKAAAAPEDSMTDIQRMVYTSHQSMLVRSGWDPKLAEAEARKASARIKK